MAIKVAGQEVISDERKITGAIGLDLTPIEATIADSAVDVFVYDTRKDSDGGAWRKRTQHTSWYNETLNTATRGARKEFPAVAVIVAEATQVTIYDGDDPDLPMWMVFTQTSYDTMLRTAANGRSVFMLNAELHLAGNSCGTNAVNFIKDNAYLRYSTHGASFKAQGIVNRNVAASYNYGEDSSQAIISTAVNDIAMTVLPNAPIDPATQLPIPTIAVATDGGVSVIKDDGTVVDIHYGSYTASRWVDFDSENALWCNFDNVITNGRFTKVYRTIPTTDQYSSGTPYNSTNGEDAKYTDDLTLSWQGDIKWSMGLPSKYDKNTFGYDDGFLILDENKPSPPDGMYSVITSTYNTGWMNGDIKLATLSDTDDTDVTGSELVTNGTFDSDTSGWTVVGNGTAYLTSNRLGFTDTDLSAYVYQNINTEVGKTYTVSYDSLGLRATYVEAKAGISGAILGNTQNYDGTRTGTETFTFVATTTTTAIKLSDGSGVDRDDTITDNVSVRLAEADRSVNGNGLQVFGTVTKNPVATGADLVAYSGIDGASNYLTMPRGSMTSVGTGDYCLQGWVYHTGSVGDVRFGPHVVGHPTGTGMNFFVNHAKDFYVVNMTDTTWTNYNGWNVASFAFNTWQHVAIVRRNGVVYVYLNGKQVASATNAYDHTEATGFQVYTNVATAKQALIRYSFTAPTAEQIKTIYESEKHLFTEGAQATLYGSSDAVTALAYDEDTNILSVGTSSGRSDFSGLRRVNNTTTAVTTAISASNSLIVEQ